MTRSTTARAAFGIHSIDHFALDVPDLTEATRFLSTFGFELETQEQQLLLRTPSSHHVWAKVQQGPRKRLRYLSLNCFADDFTPLCAQIVQAGGRGGHSCGAGRGRRLLVRRSGWQPAATEARCEDIA